MQSRFPKILCSLAALAVLSLLAGSGAAALAEAPTPQLARAQALLDQGQPEDALALLDKILSGKGSDPQALLLRSTGRIMLADVKGGVADLQKALRLDPDLRQGWLNLAGLEIAQERYGEAEKALLEARRIDPEASDNDLNLGAVDLLQGQLEKAATSFERYLAKEGQSAEALYLVASNYALAGVQDSAIDTLAKAISANERMRLRARDDERFLQLQTPRYSALLRTDSYQPAPGSHSAAAAFRIAYDPADNRLIYAVLNALRRLEISYEAQIETTAEWALVWADFRIKISNQSNGTGVVSLSAPAERFSGAVWQRRTQELFRMVHEQLRP